MDKIENSYQFLLKNAHKIWVGVRGGLSLLKLSIKNLLSKERHKFEKIELNNFETNLDLRNFKKFIKIS